MDHLSWNRDSRPSQSIFNDRLDYGLCCINCRWNHEGGASQPSPYSLWKTFPLFARFGCLIWFSKFSSESHHLYARGSAEGKARYCGGEFHCTHYLPSLVLSDFGCCPS